MPENETPVTATRWAWDELARRRRRAEVPHKLTLLAAADLQDRIDADSAHPDRYRMVHTFAAADLADAVGVTTQTVVRYCRALADHGLLQERGPRHFALPQQIRTARKA